MLGKGAGMRARERERQRRTERGRNGRKREREREKSEREGEGEGKREGGEGKVERRKVRKERERDRNRKNEKIKNKRETSRQTDRESNLYNTNYWHPSPRWPSAERCSPRAGRWVPTVRQTKCRSKFLLTTELTIYVASSSYTTVLRRCESFFYYFEVFVNETHMYYLNVNVRTSKIM